MVRDEVIEELELYTVGRPKDFRPFISVGQLQNLIDKVKKLPAEKTGKWIIDDEEDRRIWKCHCSNCKENPQDFVHGTENRWILDLPKYCPNCGSKNLQDNDSK